MHILFLSDNFPPESNAPASRLFEHSKYWINAGHQVTVITCAPNFPQGKVFEGYSNKWYQTEHMNGVKVVRVKTYMSSNEGFLKRILDYISFMIMSVIAGLFQKKPDLIVATSPQFFCAVGGWILSVLRWKPFVFELRDLWPATITAVGAMKENLAIAFFKKLEMFLYRRAKRIIAVTDAFRRELSERGIEVEKIDVVTNGVETDQFKPSKLKDKTFLEAYALEGKFVVGYIGTMGVCQGLTKVLESAEYLKNETNIQLVFAGAGAVLSDLETMAFDHGYGNVTFIPMQKKAEMSRLWSICDVSLIPLVNDPVFSLVIPSKIFESFAMGLPTIVSAPKGEITEIVEKTGAGLTVRPEDPQALAQAVIELYNDDETYNKLCTKSLGAAGQYDRGELAMSMLDSFDKAIT